jgi:hypothetical protein
MPLCLIFKPETLVTPFGMNSKKCEMQYMETLSALTERSELWRREDATVVTASAP